MFTLNYSDHRPLYEQIKEKTKELIISGALEENQPIPTVREMAQTLAINPNTIQRAYKDLESEGFIYSIRGKGSFVAPGGGTGADTRIAELEQSVAAQMKELRFLGRSEQDCIAIIKRVYEKEG